MTWLTDTRASYDTVAASYADHVRDALTTNPHMRANLTLFASLVPNGGPVADIGCGPGHVTAHLTAEGLNTIGMDLSPGMIDVARRDHPGVRFLVASMTALPLATATFSGLIAWWSLIHIPDNELPTVLAHFRRVLRPGCPLLLGFHAGTGSRLKTEGYGAHPMNVTIHRRTLPHMAARLRQAGFTIEAETLIHPDSQSPGAILFAR
jgi:ubiquinone/menaquinone biosynthesis C-methylase UbiE